MRTLKSCPLVFLFIFCAASQARAQATQGAPSDATPRFFFDVSLGGQARDQTFTTSSTFTIYGEQGAVATGQSIGGGTLLDIGAGARIWKDLGVGIAYSTVKNHNDATAVVRVPHPVIFGQSREASATVSDLEHSENVVHLQFRWTVPVTNKVRVALMLGPSFFTVRQDVATVRAPQDILDVPPYTSVSIKQVTVTDVKDSPVGFNIGIDATYHITRLFGVGVGVGGFARFSQASLDLPPVEGATINDELKAGGGQGGLGLRFGF